MKKLLLPFLAIILISCSDDSEPVIKQPRFKAPVKKSLTTDTSKPIMAQPKMSVKDSYEAEINKLKSSLSSGALDTTYVVKNKEQIQTILQLMYYNKLEELKQKNISEVLLSDDFINQYKVERLNQSMLVEIDSLISKSNQSLASKLNIDFTVTPFRLIKTK